ncbi:hypothetical protein ACUNV4_04585 [Granulosicoccus sp. 3-233]|uniref:hypothetical protein n=1 Tax=Granulosicoccus sp. 3-233 TaxID=3417969 RepID=UPI003D340DBD
MTDQSDMGGTQESSERRSSERVQDAIALHVERLTDLPAAGQVVRAPARQSVRKRDKYEIDGYAEVCRDHPEVAAYIDALEERIRELLLGGESAPIRPTHKVSLSAGGIRFQDTLLLQPGEMVGLTMTLFPSGQRIGTDALILAGNDSPEVARGDSPTYRARFVRMSDADRQTIGDHVQSLLGKRTNLQD